MSLPHHDSGNPASNILEPGYQAAESQHREQPQHVVQPGQPSQQSNAPSPSAQALLAVRSEVAKAVVGQDGTVTGLLIALLAGGHVLLEGVPGVAKTLLVRALSAALSLDTKRVQFTPDLMPGDVTGSLIYDAGTSDFTFRKGPVFTNILLADEINRTPPKTQASLLEAMEEHQVSVDGVSRQLPSPFMVAATQNPVEYEGTYPLPEAQLDRFLLKLTMDLPGTAWASTRRIYRVLACVQWPVPPSWHRHAKKWQRWVLPLIFSPTWWTWSGQPVRRRRSRWVFLRVVPRLS